MKDWSHREESEKRGVHPARVATKAVEIARVQVGEMEMGAVEVGLEEVAAGVKALRRTKSGPPKGWAFLSER